MQGTRVAKGKNTNLAYSDRLNIEEFSTAKLPKDGLRPELTLKEVSARLMEGYVDPPPQLTRNLSLSLTSTPGEPNRIGGLTSTLMPLEEFYAPLNSRLLNDIRQSIPPDLTSESQVRIHIEGIGQLDISPFSWNVYSTASGAWDSGNDDKKFGRLAEGFTTLETTIGFAAGTIAPHNLDEIWFSRADFPILIGDEIYRQRNTYGFDLELAKYLISVHLNQPTADNFDYDSFMGIIGRGLTKLRKDYDTHGFNGLVNPDAVTGSPRSILAIAKAIARSEGTDLVNENQVRMALAEFSKSREDLFELWTDLGKDFKSTEVSPKIRLQGVGKTGGRLYAYLRHNPNSTRAELREALPKVQERLFNEAIEKLLANSLIYRTSVEEDRYAIVYESV